MEEDIFESLKTWDCSDVDLSPIPWGAGFGLKGELNPMYGRRGLDNPWFGRNHKEESKLIMSNKVKASWEDSDDRKLTHSESMKQKWASGKITSEVARKNGNHGLLGKDIHNTISLEYKGKMYYGWRELHEATGVSKHLYKKYYLKGIDPEFRIGANGPSKEDIL